jgi:trk system potassium uptake protein TrkH
MREIVRGFSRFLRELHPVRLVTLGYLSYVLVGWILLVLPFAHATERISALDALFTATSAMSTTGLATASTGKDFTIFGQP